MSETAAPAAQAVSRPLGNPRSVGTVIVLTMLTFGIYGLYWYYVTHEEMKQYSGEGIGGAMALLIAALVGFAIPFITGSEVGKLYTREGMDPPVSGKTGLWVIPGFLLLFLGPLIYLAKVQGALNRFWESKGAN
jgi:hypothetical protein